METREMEKEKYSNRHTSTSYRHGKQFSSLKYRAVDPSFNLSEGSNKPSYLNPPDMLLEDLECSNIRAALTDQKGPMGSEAC